MDESVSGYAVTIPLGMWVNVEIDFLKEDGGFIGEASIVDDRGIRLPVPSKVRPLVDAYFEAWMMHSTMMNGDVVYVRDSWMGGGFFRQHTSNRLTDLVNHGLAEELHDD